MSKSDRYAILEEIASGSTATVYLAEDKLLRRKVALKCLHPHLHNHAEMVKRFAQEAFAVASLSHENIIRIFEYGNDPRDLYLAMEYIEGMTLEGLLRLSGEERGLPNLMALALFRQMLEGLAAAHARGIVHRDIKPSNVLIDRTGCVRLADFGIAFTSGGTSITRTGAFLGTPGYSAPEQAEGLDANEKTDIFATGILIYRCLTGKLPFEGETPHKILRAIMEKDPPKASYINPRILPGLAELSLAMMAKRMDSRPSAIECIGRLEEIARTQGFFFEPNRVARFRDNPLTYRKAEETEIAMALVKQARAARDRKSVRSALEMYHAAEAFESNGDAIRQESNSYQKALRARSRWRVSAAAVAGVSILVPLILLGIKTGGSSPQRKTLIDTLRTISRVYVKTDIPAHTGKDSLLSTAGPANTVRPQSVPESRRWVAVSRKGRSNADTPKAMEIPDSAKVSGRPGPTSPGTTGEEPVKGYLTIKSTPPFAKIFVDDWEAGITPTKAPIQMAPGKHELILLREGCRPLYSTFEILPGETTALRFTLETIVSQYP